MTCVFFCKLYASKQRNYKTESDQLLQKQGKTLFPGQIFLNSTQIHELTRTSRQLKKYIVSQPLKVQEAPDNKMVGKLLIFRNKFHF